MGGGHLRDALLERLQGPPRTAVLLRGTAFRCLWPRCCCCSSALRRLSPSFKFHRCYKVCTRCPAAADVRMWDASLSVTRHRMLHRLPVCPAAAAAARRGNICATRCCNIDVAASCVTDAAVQMLQHLAAQMLQHLSAAASCRACFFAERPPGLPVTAAPPPHSRPQVMLSNLGFKYAYSSTGNFSCWCGQGHHNLLLIVGWQGCLLPLAPFCRCQPHS